MTTSYSSGINYNCNYNDSDTTAKIDIPLTTSQLKRRRKLELTSSFKGCFRSKILAVLLVSSLLVSSLFTLSKPRTRALAASDELRHSPYITESIPSIPELQSYVQLSYAAFCPDAELRNWTCQWCVEEGFQVTDVLYSETTKTKGFVGYDQSRKLIVASFRGSYGHVENWWLNLRFGSTSKDFHNVTIRTGWWKAYEALQEQYWEALQQTHERCPSCTTLVTTGHSLGAAIGGLAALDAKLTFPWIRQVKMRNLGMPRVGHEDFVQLFHDHVESSYRVVHYRDIVPHYPLRINHISPYHHVGSEVWIPQKDFNGTLQLCDGSGEDPDCSGSLKMWQWDPDDHNTYLGLWNNDCGRKG